MNESETEVLRKSLLLLEGEHNSGELSDNEYETAKARYLSLGADLLDEPKDEIRVVSRTPRDNSMVRRATLWAFVVGIVIVIAIAVLLNNKSNRRPGGTATGNVVQSSDDLLAQANSAQSKGDLAGALKLYDRVLKANPQNVDALASRGWTLYLASVAIAPSDSNDATQLVDESIQSLNKAIAVDPTYAPARAWRGVVLFRGKGDSAAAIADFDAYLASAGNDSLKALVQSARDEAAKTK
jgi:tetratricopeptide (TPR) repeat protein